MKQLDQYISPLIASQFPGIYREEGPLFVAFVKAYFEWLEQNNGILNKARRLSEFRDVDTTPASFIEHFKQKYMHGVPADVLGDSRLLQKHIKEVFGSKGTLRGLQLLFQILHKEKPDVYIPGLDLLKPSDGKWVVPTYLEVENSLYTPLLVKEKVTGRRSGATAYVEEYVTQYVNGRRIDILAITDVFGTFERSEELLSDVVSVKNSPRVRGSLSSIELENGGLDFKVGDVLNVVSSRDGIGGKAVVTKTGVRDGAVRFNVVDGGSGYSNTFFEDLAGLPEQYRTAVTVTGSGIGASFEVGRLTNLSTIEVITDLIDPAASSPINAANYAWAANTSANIDTPLKDTLTVYNLTIGSIADETEGGIIKVNPGTLYTSDPTVTVVNSLIAGLNIPDGSGGIAGNNAVIEGYVQFGQGSIEEVRIIDSGLAYANGEVLVLSSANNDIVAEGAAIAQTQGKSEGYFKNTDGFLNSNKYIHDNYFYQEYSYQVRSTIPFEKYANIIEQIWHPAGLEKFGMVMHKQVAEFNSGLQDFSIVQG